MVWRPSNMIHLLIFQPVGQLAGDVTGPVVAEQPWLVNDCRTVTTRSLQREIQRVGHIAHLHRPAEFPGDDVAAVIIEDGRQIEATPADHLQIGKVAPVWTEKAMSARHDGNAVLWPTLWLKFSTGFQRLDFSTPSVKNGVFQHYQPRVTDAARFMNGRFR